MGVALLTVEDIDLIIKALKAYPDKGTAGFLAGSLIDGMLSEDRKGFEKRVEERSKKLEAEKQSLEEDVSIVIGKLVMAKRSGGINLS